MVDRKHATCIVTAALSEAPQILFGREDYTKEFNLESIAFRTRRVMTSLT